jgi:hypothetical protein
MENEKELIIICDESDKEGDYFSNFYGGVLVGGSKYEKISYDLNQVKNALNLFGEVKWQKVTERYLDKYIALMTVFFEKLRSGDVKIRIMFTHNAWKPTNLTQEDKEFGYFKLYYQFIKHAFGLQYIDNRNKNISLRIYLDEMPDTKKKSEAFKDYLHGLQNVITPKNSTFRIEKQNIAEVSSHDHVLLQCMDVVLGSMSFKLNNKHKVKLPGKRTRGKRTIAKEKLYKYIYHEICSIRPHFNIGCTTGHYIYPESRWRDPYRHWCFKAREVEYREEYTKNNPAQST